MILNINKQNLYQGLKCVNTENNTKVTPKLSLNTKELSLKDLPDTKSYALAFMGRKNYTENEQAFLNFRKGFSTKLHRASKEESIACWDFYINSTDENQKIYEDKQEKSRKIFQDEKTLKKLNEFNKKGINEPTLKKHLTDLIQTFDENITYKDELETLDKKENAISQKFNSYRGKVGDKEYSNGELCKMLEDEKNVDKRKEIYKALNGGGELIANDLVELIKMRNDFAVKKGYPDFFTMVLKKVDENKLFGLLDDLAAQTEKTSKKLFAKRDQKLAQAFNIDIDELRPHHYGLLLDDDPFKQADKYIKGKEDLLPLSESLYKRMGWDLGKMPIQYDIFPRENKNQHGFCFGIDTPGDVRILANLRDDMGSIDTLNHEGGHAVYDNGISNHIPYVDRGPVSSAGTEAVAMLIASLPYRENKFLQEKLNIPKALAEKLEDKRKEGLVRFVRGYLKYINFEKEMYKNPNQDLGKLWFDLDKKYGNKNIPEKTTNEWANIPHFLSHPAYLQNYLRAEIMAAQIYKTVTTKFGPMTENPQVARYLDQKMFKSGSTLTEDALLTKLTGSPLNPDAFSEQIKDV